MKNKNNIILKEDSKIMDPEIEIFQEETEGEFMLRCFTQKTVDGMSNQEASNQCRIIWSKGKKKSEDKFVNGAPGKSKAGVGTVKSENIGAAQVESDFIKRDKQLTVICESDFYVIQNESKNEFLEGTDRMLAVGGGVKARILKTKEGKFSVKEFVFDKNKFDNDSIKKWIENNERSIKKSLMKVQENAPKDSFQDITMRIIDAINFSNLFPKSEDGYNLAYVAWVFDSYFIVDYLGTYFKIAYSSNENGDMTLGSPEKADMEFVTKESNSVSDIKESTMKELEIIEASKSKREVKAVLIEAGINFNKKRYYPKKTIQESAPLYAGLKMYLDHPTDSEEREKPERSVDNWVSTIVESWYEDGKAIARIAIHKPWFWELIESDEVYREQIGISINASGRRTIGKIDGEQMEIIEEISNPRSVDWVTEAGARGRILQILESQHEREGDIQMLKTVTLKEVQEQRPDLVESIQSQVKSEYEAKLNASIKEANDAKAKLAEFESKEKKEKQASKIKELVESSKLPAKAKEKLISSLSKQSFETEEKLVEACKVEIESELKYLKEVAGIEVGVEGGQKIAEHSDLTKGLEARLGLKEKKDDKK